MKSLSMIVAIMLLLISCRKKNQEVQQEEDSVDTESVIAEETLENTDFRNMIRSINTIELPDTIWCGIDDCVQVEEYGSRIMQIAPKPSEYTRVYGKLPTKNGLEYIIYAVVGDINYPYLFTYDRDGQLVDSIYLHIGYCYGDESSASSNGTVINRDYSISMTDTTRHFHFNEENKCFIDSVVITKREMGLTPKNKYRIISEKRERLNKEGN